MRLETHGNAQQTMHFLNELGSNMQIRLLQMAGGGLSPNPPKDGVRKAEGG